MESNDGDEAGWVGDNTGEGGADKSAAYSSSPVYQRNISCSLKSNN